MANNYFVLCIARCVAVYMISILSKFTPTLLNISHIYSALLALVAADGVYAMMFRHLS